MRMNALVVAIAFGPTAFFAAACGDSAPEGGGGAGANDAGGGGQGGGEIASWTGHHVLRVELALATDDPYECLGEAPGSPALAVVVDVTAADGEASGWIAGTAIGNGATTIRVTEGSVAVEGSVADPALGLTPFTAFVTALDSFTFDAFALVATLDGTVHGEASGTWSIFNGSDAICDLTFSATITGGPDEERPTAWASRSDRRLNLPFEPIPLALTEPIEREGPAVEAKVSGSSVGAVLSPRADNARDGFAFALDVAPDGIWPVGGALSLTIGGLRDAAGNEGEAALEPIPLAPLPDSDPNLGFEQGLLGWLTDPLPPEAPGVTGVVYPAGSFSVVDDEGDPFVVTAPEGGTMAVVGIGGRLVGHLDPPSEATVLRLRIGLADPDVADLLLNGQGYAIRLVDATGATVETVTADASLHSPPMKSWSGFAEVEIPLPSSADGGFWIVIEPTGFAPPVHLPEVLVDALTASAS